MRNLSDCSIVVVTLDSLRFDVAMEAYTPNMKHLLAHHRFSLEENPLENWRLVSAPSYYTLPSHISMLCGFQFPGTSDPKVPGPFNRRKYNLFDIQSKPARFCLPRCRSIPSGLRELGYRTIGIGGVDWFRDDRAASAFWRDEIFKEFYWDIKFSPRYPDSFESQINLLKDLSIKEQCFLFINVSTTHWPYRYWDENENFLPGTPFDRDGNIPVSCQVKALEYIDSLIPSLIDVLPKPCNLILTSDHGDNFGEGGLWGHHYYHPKLMEVPMADLWIDQN